MGAPLYPVDAPLILIVEDDESNRELFSHTLSLAGFRVWPHERAADALASIETKRPDLVVTDLVLPGMDGAEFCRRLRANPATADVPIVLVTGWSITQSTMQHLPQGEGLSVLMKPFVPERLVLRIRRQLSRAIARSAQARPRASVPPPPREQPLRRRRILVVEDDAIYRYTICRQLKAAGAEVIEAQSAAQARTVLERTHKLDAVIADIVLPDAHAPEFLRSYEARRRIPVLYITAYPPGRWNEYGLSPTDPQLLQKPFDSQTLVERLHSLVA